MSAFRKLTATSIVLLLCACGAPGGDLDTLSDSDGNGFDEIPLPDGTEPSDESTLVEFVSNIDIGDAAASFGVSPDLAQLATITATVNYVITYEGGAMDQLTEEYNDVNVSEKLELLACVIKLVISGTIEIGAPFVGTLTSIEIPETALDVPLESCGSLISISITLDSNNQPDVVVTIDGEVI